MLNILTSRDIFTTACHTRGDAATMSELSELYFAKMGDLIGQPVPSHDPEHTFVRIEDVGEPDMGPWDAENDMIAYLDDPERRSDRRRARRKARRRLAAII